MRGREGKRGKEHKEGVGGRERERETERERERVRERAREIGLLTFQEWQMKGLAQQMKVTWEQGSDSAG